MTAIQFLMKRLLAVIWLFRSVQSNVWTKIVEEWPASERFLVNWGRGDTYPRRALWYPLAFVLGAAVYFSLRHEPTGLEYGAGVVGVLCVAYAIRQIPTAYLALPQFALMVLIWMCAGFLWSGLRTHTVNTTMLHETYDRVMVEGWVVDFETNGTRSRLMLDVHAISGLSAIETPQRIRLSQRGETPFGAGRFVRCYGRVSPPPEPAFAGEFEFARGAYFEKLGGVGFTYGACRAGVLPSSSSYLRGISNQFENLRRNTAAYVNKQGGRGGGLAAALLTGDRNYISDEDAEALRRSGMAHLLAISGLHLGLAGGAFYFLFFRMLAFIEPLARRYPVQKIAATFALVAVTFYLIFSGASVSAQRAYVMVGMAFLAILLDRPAISFSTLGIALLLVTVIAPQAVLTPGFQMSFAAAAALVRAYSGWSVYALPALPYVPQFIARNVFPIFLTSVVAGIATAPFALYHFGRIAPWGIAANFIIMPIVTVLCVPLAVLATFSMMLGVSALPLKAFGWSLEIVLDLSHRFASPGPENFVLSHPLSGWSVLFMAIAMASWILSDRWLPRRTVLFLTSALLIWVLSPSRDLVYSATGHVAFRDEASWKSLRLPGAGLRPLSFDGLPEIRCKKTCSTSANIGDLSMNESGELRLVTASGEQLVLNDDKVSIALIKGRLGKMQTVEITNNDCRPWRVSWPQCRLD